MYSFKNVEFVCYLFNEVFFQLQECAIILFVTYNQEEILCNKFLFVKYLWFILKLFFPSLKCLKYAYTGISIKR